MQRTENTLLQQSERQGDEKATFCAFFTCRKIFKIILELTVTVWTRWIKLSMPGRCCSPFSACSALNCHKMQFCTLHLRQYRNSSLASSAFSGEGDDFSWRLRLDGAQRDWWVFLYSCGITVCDLMSSTVEARDVSGHGVSTLKGPRQLLYLK